MSANTGIEKPFIDKVYGVSPRKSKVTIFACIASICLLIAFAGCITGTVCALSDDQKHLGYDSYFDGILVGNDHVLGETEVYPGYSEKRTAIAQNNGTLPMYARMQLSKYWVEEQGDTWVKSSDTSLNTDYIEVGLDESSGWVDGGDGWYYYLQEIAPSAQSTSLLKTMSFSTQIGEPNNDNNNHQVSSEYVGKGAQIDIALECVSEPPPIDDTGKDSDNYSAPNYNLAAYGFNGGSLGDIQSYFVSDTGDDISLLAYALFALSVAFFIASLCFFIIAKKRHKKEEKDLGFDVVI